MPTRTDDTEVLPWQQLTCRANRCMALRQYAAARQMYREALWEAERLMDKAVRHSEPPAAGWDALLAAWVVSHHNMAELLDVLDDVPHAHDHLRQAHEGVMTLLAQGAESGPVSQALHHAHRTRAALLQFGLRHPGFPGDEGHEGWPARASDLPTELAAEGPGATPRLPPFCN
jgi:hypothetical protein